MAKPGSPAADAQASPATLAALLDQVIASKGYRSLHELSRDTTIPYQTLWTWSKGTRNTQRPPSVKVLRKFAEDFNVPEPTVFRAAGRAYSDPGTLDSESLRLLELFKSLSSPDQARVVRIVALVHSMTPDQRIIVENVLRGIATARPDGDGIAQTSLQTLKAKRYDSGVYS